MNLRNVEDGDLEAFFNHQADPQAVDVATGPARDRSQFAAHWARLRGSDTLIARTIVVDGLVAGNVHSWPEDGRQIVGYRVGREFWGLGVATQALAQFLDEVSSRRMYAYVATHNAGSIRVLEKCGFRRDRAQEAKALAPGDGIMEFVYVLDR